MKASADFELMIKPKRKKPEGIKNVIKYAKNPFINSDIIKIDQERRQILAGTTKNVLVNTETGETEGITLLARYKEVDKSQFVKLFINEVSVLFDLSKAGIRVFGYVLQCLRVNKDEIFINIPELIKYCKYKTTPQAYRGLAELVKNKIIAMSSRYSFWYINPNIVFNGDRIMFIKEYRIKEKDNKQLTLEMPLGNDTNPTK